MCHSKFILYYYGVPLYIGVSIFDYSTKCIKIIIFLPDTSSYLCAAFNLVSSLILYIATKLSAK